jgi:hypothetical protein
MKILDEDGISIIQIEGLLFNNSFFKMKKSQNILCLENFQEILTKPLRRIIHKVLGLKSLLNNVVGFVVLPETTQLKFYVKI